MRGTFNIAAKEKAFCWGDNQFGQIGDGTTTPGVEPTRVGELTNVTAITAMGQNYASATASCMRGGENNRGDLNDGT